MKKLVLWTFLFLWSICIWTIICLCIDIELTICLIGSIPFVIGSGIVASKN
jgi:hypothetical protein